MFKVREIFYSLQGEGNFVGTPSVFCRFSGCNKWSGRESDRAKSVCSFCDTDFVGGELLDEGSLVEAIVSAWPGGGTPRVIFTGGEPALQITGSLIDSMKRRHFNVAIETNGSVPLPHAGPYWVTVSPKDKRVVVVSGHEIKVLWPLKHISPEDFEHMDFNHYYLQPVDDENYRENLEGAIQYVREHPQWSLSLQQHKILGIL